MSAEHLDALKAPGQRDRIYTPRVTLGLFVEQVLHHDQACQDAVGRALSQRLALGLSGCSLNSGPYCKARQRLQEASIQALASALGSATHRAMQDQRWQGHPVKLIDGTTASMPDTPENQAAFPQNRQQKPGLGFPIARIVGIVSLASGSVLSWTVGPCQGQGSAESMQLWSMLDQLQPEDLTIKDRGYAGYFLLAAMHQRKIRFLVRDQPQRKDDPDAVTLGPGDQLFTWRKPTRPRWMDPATYEALPAQMRLRQVRSRHWRLVTNLEEPASPEELAALYAKRWNIELDFRAIKQVMQMDRLRCQTPAMVRKEIAAHFLAYNMIRALMSQAAPHRVPRVLSFAAARRAVARFQDTLRHDPQRPFDQALRQLLHEIAASKISLRPNRVEPRAIKRRPRPFPRLAIPRLVARHKIIQQRAAGLR